MNTSDLNNITAISRRRFIRTASLAATAVTSCIVLPKAKGEPPAIDDATMCPAVPVTPSGNAKLGTDAFKGETPLSAIGEHVCGLHFYSGNINRQVIAHHYCSHVSRDIRQCVIYESDKKHARLVGIEYIISSNLFETLSLEEKRLWHSHVYEVKSGQLVAPGMQKDSEREAMMGLVGTYGKTWYTWQTDRGDKVPLGIPQLMMAFTADGQAAPELLSARDKLSGVVTEDVRRGRSDLIAPAIQPGADAWQKGEATQLQAVTVKMNVSS
jgi:hypothetical protein